MSPQANPRSSPTTATDLYEFCEAEATIRNADPDAVVAGTPHDLSREVDVDAPIVRVHYEVGLHEDTFDDLLARHAGVLGLD